MPQPSQNLLLEIVKTASIGIFEFNTESGVLKVDDTYAASLGYEKEELTSLEIWQKLTHPDHAERVREEQKMFLTGNDLSRTFIYALQHKNGLYIWARITLFKSDNSNIIGCLVDLSEEHRALQKIAEAKEEAERNEERYRKLLTNLETGIIVHDNDSSIITCNERALELLGVTKQQIEGKVATNLSWDFICENHLKVLVDDYPIMQVLKTKKALRNKILGIIKSNQEILWVLVNGFPTLDDEGNVIEVTITFSDITERKKQEEELRLFESVIKSTKDAVLLTESKTFDFPGPKIVFVNTAFCEMTGYTPEEIIGKTPRILQGPNSDRQKLNQIRESLENWQPFETELINYKKNGEEFWVNLSISPLTDKKGNVTHWIAVERDITEQKKQEEELRLFESVIKNTNDAVLITEAEPIDMKGPKIKFVNKAFCDITGYTQEELIGKTPRILQGPKSDREVLNKIRNSLKNWQPFETELINYKKNGEEFWVNISLTPLADETGWFTHWIAVERDITHRKAQEKELKLFESIIKNTKDAVLISEINHVNPLEAHITFVNNAFCELTGYNSSEILGLTPVFLQGALTDKTTVNKIEEATKELKTFEYELINYKKNGESFWANLSVAPMLDQNNRYTHWISIIRDISLQKEQDIKLRDVKEKIEASEKQFRQLVNNSNDIIYSINPDGIFTFASAAWTKLLGHLPEEAVGRSFTEFVHPDDIPQCAAFLQKVLDTGEQQSGVEYRVKHKDGHIVWHTSSATPLKDNEGNIIGYDGLARDITASKKMQNQLITAKEKAEESEQRLTLATNSAQIGIWDWDINNDIVSWDKKTFELYGYDISKVNSSYDVWLNALHPDDRAGTLEELEKALEKGTEYNATFRVIHQNGKQLYLTVKGLIDRDTDGKATRIIGINRDITEEITNEIKLKKAKEKAEAASIAKSEFLANMSHEIRTPLNSVIGFSELLMQTTLDNSQKDYMHSVNYSANTLLDLINDILDFSKIEAGKFEVDLGWVNLHELLYQIVDMVKFKLKEKAVELLLYIASDIPRYVMCDAIRIRQILVNLMSNAVKFTQSGEIEMSIVTLKEPQNEEQISLRFEVRDTGIGISESQQKSIFDAFSQEDTSITRKYGGTGLGLTISNQLLKLMGSTLQLTSTQGKGSSFYFDIDFDYEIETSTEHSKDDFNHIKNILLVDDNNRSIEIIKNLFNNNNVIVETANSGFEGLSKIQDNWKHYDLVLLDCKMPYVDGKDVVLQIKEKLKLNDDQLPIIMMDGILTKEEREQIKENYSTIGFINKPILKGELLAQISLIKNTEIITSEAVTIASNESEVSNLNDKSILIVDDNFANRKLVRSIINKLYKGIEILEADSGKAALEQVTQNNFNLIFMDIQMPDMSGYETARAIRNLQGYKNQLGIVALTARTVKGEKERCLAAGMDDYLSKPITIDKLTTITKKWLEKGGCNNAIEAQETNNSDRLDFNYKYMLAHLDEDAEVAEEIIDIIRDGHLKDLIKKLNETYQRPNTEDEIQLIAHSIKGLCLSLYFENLADMATQLENMHPNYSGKSAILLITQISTNYQIVEKIIDKKEYLIS